MPDYVAEWWEESSSSRFTGLGWWMCEICDISAHQVPFLVMVYVLRSNGLWGYIHDHIRSLALVAVAGPLTASHGTFARADTPSATGRTVDSLRRSRR